MESMHASDVFHFIKVMVEAPMGRLGIANHLGHMVCIFYFYFLASIKQQSMKRNISIISCLRYQS